jgi:hypothetical protein
LFLCSSSHVCRVRRWHMFDLPSGFRCKTFPINPLKERIWNTFFPLDCHITPFSICKILESSKKICLFSSSSTQNTSFTVQTIQTWTQKGMPSFPSFSLCCPWNSFIFSCFISFFLLLLLLLFVSLNYIMHNLMWVSLSMEISWFFIFNCIFNAMKVVGSFGFCLY